MNELCGIVSPTIDSLLISHFAQLLQLARVLCIVQLYRSHSRSKLGCAFLLVPFLSFISQRKEMQELLDSSFRGIPFAGKE